MSNASAAILPALTEFDLDIILPLGLNGFSFVFYFPRVYPFIGVTFPSEQHLQFHYKSPSPLDAH